MMKECEIFSNLKVPCASKIIIRVDGRNFSKLTKALNLNKPFDKLFIKSMVEASSIFFNEFSPDFIYIFSDEINILLSEIPFRGRVEKIDSIFASFIGSVFTKIICKNYISFMDSDPPIIPSFDARIIILPQENIYEYFKNRQNEAWRNCLNGYAYWTLRKKHGKEKTIKMLYKKNKHHLNDILFDRDINISEFPVWQRRGVAIYKKDILTEGYNPVTREKVISTRKKLFVDWALPIFDNEFFKHIL
jgi:tRNA(His) guanylyltransferase